MADNDANDQPTADLDAKLLRAWVLFDGEVTDETFDEAERLIPDLVAAGYVDAQDDRWGFSSAGVARAEELDPDEPAIQQTQPKGIDPKTGKPYEPVEIPMPKRGTWDRLLKRAETTPPPKD
jgi:hypothetical protein